jgi:hypothetical protein
MEIAMPEVNKNAKAKPKQVRQGPVDRTIYIVFNPDTPAEFIQQVRNSVMKLTADGRSVIESFKTGQQVPILPMKVHVTPKPRGGAQSAE